MGTLGTPAAAAARCRGGEVFGRDVGHAVARRRSGRRGSSPVERAGAFAIALATCVIFVLIAPSARVALPRVWAFVPAYESALALADLIAAVLLFAHFNRGRSYAVLILACAYFFNAAIIAPHLLTFPGVFSETGLLGAGPQSTAWLYIFWHGGFALFVLAFAVLRRTKPDARTRTRPLRLIYGAVIAIVATVAALTALATAGASHLTTIVENGDYSRLVTTGVSPAICAIARSRWRCCCRAGAPGCSICGCWWSCRPGSATCCSAPWSAAIASTSAGTPAALSVSSPPSSS